MTYFSQEFANVLGRTSRDHLVRPHDHGTQITEIRCPRNSTPSLLKRRASTSATMFQSSSLPHPRRPARTDLSSGEARTPRRIYSPAANEQLPTTTLPSHLSSAEGVPGGHRSTPSARNIETASGMVARLHAFRTRLDGHLLPQRKVVVTLEGRLVVLLVAIRPDATACELAVKGNHA